MYALYTKIKREPFYIEDDVRGARLYDAWLNNKLPAKIDLGGFAIHSETIKSIEAKAHREPEDIRETKKDEEKEHLRIYIENTEREYREYRNKRLALSPEERGKNILLANMVWHAHTGQKEMPKEIEEQVVARQQAFFRENPNNMYASPICYRDVIEPMCSLEERSDFSKTVHLFGMRIVERLLSTDKACAHVK